LTRRDLTRLLVRIFGLFILVGAVAGLPASIYGFATQVSFWNEARVIHTWRDAAVVAVMYFGPFVAYTAVGLCFLWWSGRIIDKASLAPEPGENEAPVVSTDLRNIEISLVAVLGLYFLADGLAELCRAGLGPGLRYQIGSPPSFYWYADIPFIVDALVKLIIGSLLVLGRGGTVAVLRGVRVWVRKMRTWPN
jgi:hypothetical protein